MNTDFQPGVEGVYYDLPSDVYHKAPGVSQSTLKAFDEAGSPLHYKKVPRKPSSADQAFGTLTHAAVLEPQSFPNLFHVQPVKYEVEVMKCPNCGKVSDSAKCRKCNTDRVKSTIEKEWSGNAEWCHDWLEEHKGRLVIDNDTHYRVKAAADALIHNTGIFSKALASKHARREVSYFKRDEETGLLLKGRVDLEVTDQNGHLILFDPKKVEVGGGSEEAFQKQVANWGYHIQHACYMAITGAAEMYFVPFDDDFPFQANIWSLRPEWRELGGLEYRRILRAFAKCHKADVWPGYHQDGRELPMPGYLKKRIVELNAEITNAFLSTLPVREGGAS